MKAFLNVGGGSKAHPVPSYFAGWRHDLLDIDPAGKPDIVLDARELMTLPPATYDAIYCAHNLEHYHRHDGAKVLRGFLHVLKPEGFVDIRVPDLEGVFKEVVARQLDVDDVLYLSPSGEILVRDVLYGFHVEIERSGQDFYSHKTGFTKKALANFVRAAGFVDHAIANQGPLEIIGLFFKQSPSPEVMQMLGLTRK